MRWLLVYWIIYPHHPQAIHVRDFESHEACVAYVATIASAHRDKAIHWHCSQE